MRSVVWSEEARRDYLEIVRYVAADNPFAAERIAAAVEKTGSNLGRLATGRPGRVAATYEKPVGRLPYIIAYAIVPNAGREVVAILRVIHTSRDWPEGEWPE